MSKKVPQEQYEKTISYKFRQWLNGSKDPYLDTVEMKPQVPFCETESERLQREEDNQQLAKKVYDLEHNAEIRLFGKMYKVFSVIFCLFLVTMLLIGVSYLPTFGHPENPANNEVAGRYSEKGLQETGAVTSVTGMILD